MNKALEYATSGDLWIYFQYIEKGNIDEIEADLTKGVRDSYLPLFENTRIVLDRLLSQSEHDRVARVYKAALTHRLKAFKDEYAIYTNPKIKMKAQKDSLKWIKHYFQYFVDLVSSYEALLIKLQQNDPGLENYRNLVDKLTSIMASSKEKPL